MEEGKDKGKKMDVIVAINVNTKNIKWKEGMKVRLEYDKSKKRYTYIK